MNTDNKKNSPTQKKELEDKRSVVLHFKATPSEATGIREAADKCGMTISSYLRSRALGYEPPARLSVEEKGLIVKLAQCRADIANFINAINGLNSEEKRRLFHNRDLMYRWYSEVKPIADAVSEFIREIRNMRPKKSRTTNQEEKEVRL